MILPLFVLAIISTRTAAVAPPVETNYVDFATELRGIKCGPEQDYSSLRDAHLIHYTSDANYDSFDGYDLVKTNRPEDVASLDGLPKTVICVGDDKDDGTWHVQRIGPFRSTGGNDWWQFAWLDMFGFDGSLGDEHHILGVEPLALTGHWTGPVTGEGKPIGLPPLHIHHIHLTPGAGLSFSSDFVDCVTAGTNCPDGSVFYAHHGDRQAMTKDNPRQSGFHTFGEDYGNEWAKNVHTPISCTGEINDLRPAGSPEIVWWYQSAVRVVRGQRAKAKSPLSVHYLYNPFEMGIDTQISRFGTYKVHPSHDSVHIYTGRMPYGGELIHADSHTHMAAAQQMFLFEGSPEDLGLEAMLFDNTWVPLSAVDALHSMGLKSVSEPADGTNNQQIVEVLSRRVSQHHAYQVCHSKGNRAAIDDREWDRAASLNCNPWSFESGTQYTSVAFNGNPTLPGGRGTPGLQYNAISKLTHPFSNPPDLTFPQHSHWFLSYASRDEHSKYTWAFGSQDPDAATPVLSKLDLIRLLVWGAPRHGPGFFDTYVLIPVINLAFLLLSVFDPTFTWFSPWPLRLAFNLLLALFLCMLAAFRVFVWVIRNPEATGKVNHLSLRLSERNMLTPPEPMTKLSESASYLAGMEVVSYLSLTGTIIAAFAAYVTMFLPGDVYLVNEFDQALIKEAGPGLKWSTGKPQDGLSFLSVVTGILILLGLGAVTTWCLRLTKRAGLIRCQLSLHKKDKELQTLTLTLDGIKDDQNNEDVPMLKNRV